MSAHLFVLSERSQPYTQIYAQIYELYIPDIIILWIGINKERCNISNFVMRNNNIYLCVIFLIYFRDMDGSYSLGHLLA